MESDNSADASKNFCIFCGSSVSSVSEAYQNDLIRSTVKNAPKKEPTNVLRKLLQKTTNPPVDNDVIAGEQVYLCDECNGITVKALESRSHVEQLEVDVRQLQKQLLDVLKKLQGEMEIWNQEMCKIEDKVYKRSSSAGDQPIVSFNKCQDKTMEEVRSRIIEMMTDLRLYQSNMEDKLILLSRMETRQEDRDPLEEDRDQFTPVTGFSDQQDAEIITCDASLSDEESKGEEDDTNTTSNYFVGHLIGIGGELEEGAEESTLFSSLLYGDHSQQDKGKDKGTSQNSPRKNGKVKRLSKFKSVNLSRMCSFKKGLIKRAMERESKRKLYDDHHDNPLIKYFLRYDPSYDTFYVGDVQIRLRNEQESVLDCMGVECAMSWTPPQQANNERATTFDRDIRNHVIGKHLGGFACRVCGLVLDSYFKLMGHFKKQHPGQKPLNDLCAEKGRGSQRSNTAASQGHHVHETRFQTLDRFRRKVAKFPSTAEDQMSESVPSPSEGLKQVRITMRSAIESLGSDQGNSTAQSTGAWEPPKKKSRRSNSKVGKKPVWSHGVEGQNSINFGGDGVIEKGKGGRKRKTRGKKKR